MTFEIGKYYEHPTGKQLKIVGIIDTDFFGKCFCAETNDTDEPFKACGMTEDHAVNWFEISKNKFYLHSKK